MKPAVVSWVVSLFANPTVLLAPTSKLDRGFESDATGHLLCPIDYNWEDEVYVNSSCSVQRHLCSVAFDKRFAMAIQTSSSLQICGLPFFIHVLVGATTMLNMGSCKVRFSLR
jgi:hypothetical protein